MFLRSTRSALGNPSDCRSADLQSASARAYQNDPELRTEAANASRPAYAFGGIAHPNPTWREAGLESPRSRPKWERRLSSRLSASRRQHRAENGQEGYDHSRSLRPLETGCQAACESRIWRFPKGGKKMSEHCPTRSIEPKASSANSLTSRVAHLVRRSTLVGPAIREAADDSSWIARHCAWDCGIAQSHLD